VILDLHGWGFERHRMKARQVPKTAAMADRRPFFVSWLPLTSEFLRAGQPMPVIRWNPTWQAGGEVARNCHGGRRLCCDSSARLSSAEGRDT
jgi:hypothetical protein